MGIKLRSAVVCITAVAGLCALVPAGAAAARFEWSTAITLETPAGPVTCGETPPGEPNWAEVLLGGTLAKPSAEVLGASTLNCATSTYGTAHLTGTGFPWHFTVNTKSGKATVKGTKKVGLEITLASFPGAKCLYQASKLTGTLSSATPPVLTLSGSVKLNKASFFLCPAGGSFSGSFPLG